MPEYFPQTFYIVEKYSIMRKMTMWEGNAMTFQELMDCWDRGEYNCNRAVYDKILEHAERSNLVPVIGAGLSA